MSKFFLYLVLILFLSNCGFKDKKVEQNPNAITLFEKSKPIKQELNPALNIKISTITKGEPFLSNNSNNSGNLDFNSNFEKVFSYKFSTIDQFKFNQPEILFTEDNSLVFFTGKGEIFKTSDMLRDEDAEYLKNIALEIQKGKLRSSLDLGHAKLLMKLAKRARPKGPLINNWLDDFEKRLGASKKK